MNRILFVLLFFLFANTVYASGFTDLINNRAEAATTKRRQDIATRDLDSFPLWNSTWIAGKGQNDRIYPSISKAIPTHLIKVTFPQKPDLVRQDDRYDRPFNISSEITLEYAILTGQRYKSTSGMINDALRQFQRNKVTIRVDSLIEMAVRNEDAPIMISRRSVQDTLWFCDFDFNRVDRARAGKPDAYTEYRIIYRENGADTVLTWRPRIGIGHTVLATSVGTKTINAGDTLFFSEKPIALGVFPRISDPRGRAYEKDTIIYDLGGGRSAREFYKDKRAYGDEDGWRDHCDEQYCYERIHLSAVGGSRQPGFNFWQVHLASAVWWYPYDAYGRGPIIHDSLKMTFKKAKEMRNESIKYSDVVSYRPEYGDIDSFARRMTLLKNYRRPHYSDSASCVISFQFQEGINDGQLNRRIFGLPEILYTAFSKPAANTGNNPTRKFDDFSVNRIPNRIVRIPNMPDAVPVAIMRLYAESRVEDELAKNTPYRCGAAWRETDTKVGEDHRFPDSVVFEEKRKNWQLGMPIVPLWRQKDDWIFPGGTDEELVFAAGYSDKKYTYNHCACLPIPELNNITASELRTIVYKMPPLCAVPSMANALYVLLEAQKYLTNEHDLNMLHKRIVMVYNSIEERSAFYRALTPAQIQRGEAACVDSWEVYFRDNAGRPLYRSAYTPDLKTRAEQVVGQRSGFTRNARQLRR